MKNVIVMGGLGSGIIASSIIDLHWNMNLLGFINDGFPVGTLLGKFRKIPVIGKSEDIYRFLEDENTFVILAYKTMKKEKEMWEKYVKMDLPKNKLINIIHPTAIIPKDYCQMGNGILMAANSQVSADVVISDSCMLFGNAFVGHDSFLEEYVTVANNASIGAEVHIGKAAHIGSNCTIRQKVKIGDYSLVGMGALILEDVPENCIVTGSPAKILKYK